MTIWLIDIWAFVPPEDDPWIMAKHVVGNNKILLILGTCVDGIIRIMLGPYLRNNKIYVDISSEKTAANTNIYKHFAQKGWNWQTTWETKT